MDEEDPSPLRYRQLMAFFPGSSGSAWHLAYVLEETAADEVRLRIIGPGREGEECLAPLGQLRDAGEMVRPSRATIGSRVPGTMLAGEWAIERRTGRLVQLLEDALDRSGRPVRVREYQDGALHARPEVPPERLIPLADVVDELRRRFAG
ncbi:hypothetical protein EPN42_11180 [bacterium]|nr:MAG: hypothetical protein EPN42_11180 [bacterium]